MGADTNERRKQLGFREAEARAVADILENDGEYWTDSWGNRIKGRRPETKAAGYSIDSSGTRGISHRENGHQSRVPAMPSVTG